MMQAFKTLDLRELSSPQIIGAQIAAEFSSTRVVLVRTNAQLSCRREFWDDVLQAHGERIAVDEDSTSGTPISSIWSDVTFDPSHQDRYRHSATAQPLHTDGAYVRDPPQIVFLICHRAAPQGGATTFLDGLQLMEALTHHGGDLRERLTSIPMRFNKGGSEVESPILTLHPNGPLLRWNYYALDSELSDDARALAASFKAFLHDLTERNTTLAIRLREGDAVFFHDSRVLHGRESFVASAVGERCLWKGGLRLTIDSLAS